MHEKKIAMLRKKYICSKAADLNEDSVELWIKGFQVSKSELKQGYLGHFARVATESASSGKCFLRVEKVFKELGKHQQRKYRGGRRHPNWGHPILRMVKKRKLFSTVEEAEAALDRLRREYPNTAIPVNRRLLRIQIFGPIGEERKKGVENVALEVAEFEGNVRIICQRQFVHVRGVRPTESYFTVDSICELALGLEFLNSDRTALRELS